MRKFIITGMALAVLAVPATASAHTVPAPKFQEQTATFTVEQPKDATGQYSNVWKHDFKVTVNPCDDTFTGTGKTYDNQGDSVAWTEDITGSFGNGTISFATVPNAGATFKVTNAPFGTSVVAESTWTQNVIEMKASAPSFTAASTTVACDSEFISMAEIRNTLDIGVLTAQKLANTGGITFKVNGMTRPSDDVKLLGATLGYNVGGINANNVKSVTINGKPIKASRLAEIIAQWKASH